MKVVSRGPIVRWSLRRPTNGVIISRDDWRGGRNLEAEEKPCGLLLRRRDTSRGTSSDIPLLSAVVKAQGTDYQVNEVRADGNIAVLESTPKGKWRKISRQKTILVEDNAGTPFSDPSKSLSPRVQSYGEYAMVGKNPSKYPLLHFVVYRDCHSKLSIENRLGYTLSLKGCSLYLHEPPGGSFGCLTQHGICVGMTKELLPHVSRHYNIHPLIFDPREYTTLHSLNHFLQRPKGHYYRILLRCVEGSKETIEDQLRTLCEEGFINYFGVDTFGVGSNKMFEVASYAEAGNFRGAIGSLLQCVAECDGVHYDYFLRYLNADPSTVSGISSQWADAAKHMRSQWWVVELIEGLVKFHNSEEDEEVLRNVWDKIPFKEKIISSAAEFVWNAMVSQRVLSKGLNVVEGDIVRVSLKTNEGQSGLSEYRLATSEDIKNKVFDITDVVLPVPYGPTVVETCLFPNLTPLDRCLYEEFAKKHKVLFLFNKSINTAHPVRETMEIYRPLVVKPQGLQTAILRDPNSFAVLKSDLMILQERKPIETTDLSYASRVREPCVYNVSERFVEKMKPVIQLNRGDSSVVVSCFLPSFSSPFVMLREVFSLHYASFQDIYGVL